LKIIDPFVESLTDEIAKSLIYDESVKGKSLYDLHQVLADILSNPGNNPSQTWSTMHKKLDFPKSRDKYFAPILEDGDGNQLQFEMVANKISQQTGHRVHVIHSVPGMGKSRCAQEMYPRLVAKLENHSVIILPLVKSKNFMHFKKMQRPEEFNDDEICGFIDETFKVVDEDLSESQREKLVEQRKWRKDFLQNLQDGKVFVILDGFDEVLDYNELVVRLLQYFVAKGARVLVTTRTYVLQRLQEVFPSCPVYKLIELSEENVLLFLQSRLNKSRSDLEAAIKFLIGFLSTPMDLITFCEYQKNKEKLELNLFNFLQKSVDMKIDDGIQRHKNLNQNDHKIEFKKLKREILNILTDEHCWNALNEEQRKKASMSGIVQVAPAQGTALLVNSALKEFLQVYNIVDSKFDPKNKYLQAALENDFCEQRFLSSYLNCEENVLPQKVKDNIKTAFRGEKGFRRVCRDGLLRVFEIVEFGTASVREWASKGDEEPLIMAFASNEKLAMKLWEIIEGDANTLRG
jgi:hypothetical protein